MRLEYTAAGLQLTLEKVSERVQGLLAASGSRKLLRPKHEKFLNLLRITPRKIRQPPDLETLPLLRHNSPGIDVKRLSRHVAARVAGEESHGFGAGHSAAQRAAADRVSWEARLKSLS